MQLTYADLALFMFWDSFANVNEMAGFTEVDQGRLAKLMSVFPLLAKLHRRVKRMPNIQVYLRRRPHYTF